MAKSGGNSPKCEWIFADHPGGNFFMMTAIEADMLLGMSQGKERNTPPIFLNKHVFAIFRPGTKYAGILSYMNHNVISHFFIYHKERSNGLSLITANSVPEVNSLPISILGT